VIVVAVVVGELGGLCIFGGDSGLEVFDALQHGRRDAAFWRRVGGGGGGVFSLNGERALEGGQTVGVLLRLGDGAPAAVRVGGGQRLQVLQIEQRFGVLGEPAGVEGAGSGSGSAGRLGGAGQIRIERPNGQRYCKDHQPAHLRRRPDEH